MNEASVDITRVSNVDSKVTRKMARYAKEGQRIPKTFQKNSKRYPKPFEYFCDYLFSMVIASHPSPFAIFNQVY